MPSERGDNRHAKQPGSRFFNDHGVLVSDTMVSTDAPLPAWRVWGGRVLTVLPSLVLVMSAAMKLSQNPKVIEGMVQKDGFPAGAPLAIGLVELACLILYLVPRTAVLGAVLLTGYLGGAIVTHVRHGEPFVAALVVALMAWGGLYLREPRLWALLPLRR